MIKFITNVVFLVLHYWIYKLLGFEIAVIFLLTDIAFEIWYKEN